MATHHDTRLMNRTAAEASDPELHAQIRAATFTHAAELTTRLFGALLDFDPEIDLPSILREFHEMHFDAAANPITAHEAAEMQLRHRWDGAKPPLARALMEEFGDWHAYHAAQRRKN